LTFAVFRRHPVRSVLLAAILLLSVIGHGPGWAQNVEREPILLVATPDLRDPNFEQTVVLVLFPSGGGPLGVILNRPIPVTLKDAFPDEPQLRGRTDPLYFGGPVHTTALMYLFRGSATAAGAFPVFEDLCLSGNGDLLDQLLSAPQGGVQRYFLGYSGWAPVQLEMEIARGGWYVLPADRDTILNMDPAIMWRELLARATAVKT
jgi:putative transcriptional regulator